MTETLILGEGLWSTRLVFLKLAPGIFRVNGNLEMLVFEERGKPECPEKNFSDQGREPTTNNNTLLSIYAAK